MVSGVAAQAGVSMLSKTLNLQQTLSNELFQGSQPNSANHSVHDGDGDHGVEPSREPGKGQHVNLYG